MMSHKTVAPSSPLTGSATEAPFSESYDLIRELGRGGMAIVYLMRERATGHERAVKVIHTKFVDDNEVLARFDREARLVAQLNHPNIVATHSVKWIEGVGFGLVMDRISGRTLKQILRDGPPISFEHATTILDDIAAALGYAHQNGIVHRDVKPENIFVDDVSGHALLADFGIARSVQSETQLTLAGAAIGTPTYMAPEQIDGCAIDARSDLYSLGLVGWEMLTGRRPWDGETLYNVIYRQKHDQLAAIDALRPDTPARLVCAIEGLLEKSPVARWQTAGEFRDQLASAEPPVRREHRDVAAAPDKTIAITAPAARRVRSRLRSLAPAGAAAALLLSATLLFARPAPSWLPVRTSTPPEARSSAIVRRPTGTLPSAVPAASSNASLNETNDAVDTGFIPVENAAIRETAASSDTPHVTPLQSFPAASASGTARLNERFAIAAGGAHTCLITASGATYCWGDNSSGQLGTGATQTSTTPTPVAGSEHFSSIAPGLSHTCAISARGSLFCWGSNQSGQLGDGTHESRDVPTRVGFAQSLTAVASGAGYSCGLTGQGHAYCWGAGARGQIGDGALDDRPTPVRVSGSVAFTALAPGWNHVCALSEGGLAYCWGANDAGQLGDGSTVDHSVPTLVHTASRFTTLSAGNAHTCGTTTIGVIYCWGDNKYGQLGDGTREMHSTPVAVNAPVRFVALSAGSVHTCAVTQSHDAWCWGRNTYGQLGDGSATTQPIPVRVSGGHDFTSVRAFGAHTCGTTTSDDLFCWGYNLDGQLGDGTREHRLRPTYIEKPAA